MGYAPDMPISFVLEYQEIPIQERLILVSIQKASTFFSGCYFNSSRPSASVNMRICWMAILLSFCKLSG